MSPLHETLNRGFLIDGAPVPWGTLGRDIERLTGLQAINTGASDQTVLPAAEIFDLPALTVALRSPAEDRPVVSAWYEIDAARLAPKDVIPAIETRLGAAHTHERHDAPGSGHDWASVAETAGWSLGDSDVGVSIYGGPRPEGDAFAVAGLWHTWSEAKAALPFIAEWQARAAALARYAGRMSAFEAFSFDLPQTAFYMVGKDASNRHFKTLHERRDAFYALNQPQLLPTPDVITARTGESDMALWSSAVDGIWCLSTRWISIAFDHAEHVEVSHSETRPAKGGGSCEISVDGWFARASYPSAEVGRAAAAVARIPGVSLALHEGYDV